MVRATLLLLVLAAAATADPVVEPAHVYRAPHYVYSTAIAIGSEPGDPVLVMEHRYSVDLVAMGLAQWPWLWTPVALFAGWWLAKRWRRYWQRRKLGRAERYCRACLYDLRATGDAACPECGADTAAPGGTLVGLPVRVPLAAIAAAGLVLVVVTLGAWSHAGRTLPEAICYRISASGPPQWKSTRVAAWLVDHGLIDHFVHAGRYETFAVSLGPAGRGPRRVAWYWPYHITQPAYSSDTGRLYVDWDSEALEAIDLDDPPHEVGRIYEPRFGRASQFFPSADETRVHYIGADGIVRSAELLTALNGHPAWRQDAPSLEQFPVVAGRQAWVPRANRAWAGFTEAGELAAWFGQRELRLWDPTTGRLLRTMNFAGDVIGAASSFEDDDATWFLLMDPAAPGSRLFWIERWDLATGVKHGEIDLPDPASWPTIDVGHDGRYLYAGQSVAGAAPAIHVYDLTDGRWLDRTFRVPGAEGIEDVRALADGRTLVVRCRFGDWHDGLASFDLPE